jgi:LysR family transcriptional regulator for metE and metH
MDLEVRHLKLVRAVAASGGLTRAGRELHLSQSALSHQLRDVESHLGTPLFLRVGKRMVLTAAGERLRRSADEILGTLERTEDAIRHVAGGSAGRLRVTTGGYTEYHWLPPLVKRFGRVCPRVDLQIVAGAHGEAAQLIVDGQIDVGIVAATVEDARLSTRELFEDDVVAIVPPRHAYASRPFVEARDFADQVLLIDAPPADHTVYKAVFGSTDSPPRSIQVVPQSGALIELVKAGLGIGLIARWAVAPLVASGRLRALALTSRGTRNHWHALLLKEMADLSYVREFLAIAVDAFNQSAHG